jgi:hypothetical protein
LSFCYAIGAALHLADLLDLRLKFSEMSTLWEAWILFLFFFDSMASVGLWKKRPWGVALFVFISVSQLAAYIGFRNFFGDQRFLISFHMVTLFLLAVFLIAKKPSNIEPDVQLL